MPRLESFSGYGPVKGVHAKAKNERFTAADLRCRQNLKNENSTTSFGRLRQKNFAKKRAPRAARLFSLIQPIKSLICGVVFVISYSLISETKLLAKYTHARIGEHFRRSFRVACPPCLARARVFSISSVSCRNYRSLAVQDRIKIDDPSRKMCFATSASETPSWNARFAKFDSPINSKLKHSPTMLL